MLLDTTPHTIIPAHTLATWLLNTIDNFLDAIGLSHHQVIEEIIYFVVIVAASYFIGWIVKKIILFTTKRLVKLENTSSGRMLLDQHTFTKCSHFIPPLVFLSLAPFAFDDKSEVLSVIIRVSAAYLACTVAIGINAVLRFTFTRYNEKENTRNLPLNGILNIACGVVWVVTAIVAISLIVQKSPAALLGGMTAFAAVLMLVFKDSILGFVAGIQMSQNDMLHVGDWIVVPNTPANGTVMDVSLTTVKVRNFDNTIITVPPYTLVSTSFQNWRGMAQSGVRRIAECIYINPDTITATTPEMLSTLSAKYPSVKSFVDKLQAKGQTVAWDKGVAPLNGTIETNIGLFRAFIGAYLLSSPMIDPTKDMMVRIDSITAKGVPIRIYCFSITTQWQSYEAVMSAVLEYALMHAPAFGLEILTSQDINVKTLPA